MSAKLKPYKMNVRYIADGIKDDYITWKARESLRSSTKVFIDSPTGTGKTSFIIKELLPFATKFNRNILYIGNRTAIQEQTKNVLQYNEPQLICVSDANGSSTFVYPGTHTHITLLNYQSALSFNDFLGYYYVIFDEVHFFLEDALFNSKTYEIFDKLLRKYMDSVNIFMSATMTEFANVYGTNYSYYMPAHSAQKEVHKAIYSWDVRYYENSYAQPTYNATLYEQDDYLFDAICKSSKEEKWLIFVSSKQKGELLKRELSYKTDRKCIFISSLSKRTKAWKTLVEKGQFDANILITTKVLDNGVNLTDTCIKHIAIPFCDKTEFIQMIGRRRLTIDEFNADTDSEKINLYIRQPKIQEINSKLKTYKKAKAEFENVKTGIQKYQENKKEKKEIKDNSIQKLIRKFWNNNDNTINKMFSLRVSDNNIFIILNPFAEIKLDMQINLYEMISKDYKNPYLFSDIIKNWFGNALVNLNNGEAHIYGDTLLDFLDKNIGVMIKDTDSFYATFITLYKSFCYKKKKESMLNEEWLSKALSIRKGTTQRKGTLNRSITYLDLPYVIKKKNNCWIVEKIPQ